MEEIIIQLIHWFKELSYFGITLALTFEFIPAEIILPMVGYWVYQGELNIYLAILAGSIGGVTGPLTLYFLGKYGGRPIVLKYGKYFLIKHKDIEKSEKTLLKYGNGIAFFGRFMPVVRTVVSIPCGLVKMNVYQFMLYTYLAMLPITAIYVYLGYRLGPNWEKAANVVGGYLNYVAIFILLGVGYLILKRRKAG